MATQRPLILIMILSSMLGACASSVRTGPIPEQGLMVSQIYNQVINENEAQDLIRIKGSIKQKGIQNYRAHYEGAFHQAFTDISHEFKPLNNPTIPIYISPKVVLMGDEQIIKPGFVTQFYLFKNNQFALNSERY